MKRKLLWTSLLACLLLALLCCAAESGDFTIDENGVLTKYTGSDAVVTVPDGVTAIGKEAFYAKSAITEIHLPTGITSIGDSAFRSCTGLTELQLPTGITSIGANAFRSCTGLTEIVVPDSVETIGDNAFYDCSGLTSLRLSQGLKTLGTNVFLRCNSLTEIEIPAGVENVGNYIASNTLRLRCAVGSSAAKALSKAQNDFWVEDFQLRYAFDSDGSAASLTLKKYAGDAASVTIPDGVTIVGDSVFERNASMTSVVLPDSVVTIGTNAFRSCTGLTAVTLSQNLNEIKTYAFGGCTGLTYIDIPAGLQKSQYIMGTSDERVQLRCAIGSDAAKALSEGGDSFCADDYQLRYSFDSDGQVTGLTVRKYLGSAAVVTLPEGTTEIGSEVFKNHTEITEVVLPETLVTIGSSAFDGCTGLMRIVLPEALKTISFDAFMNCAALTEIVLPDGLTSLGSHAFYGCKKLTEMRVPDGILTLEVAAFEYCANLTKVVLPSKLEKIANYAFHNCKALKEIQIPETVTEIGIGAFQYCAGLTELTLPEGLQTIGESAFVGCSGLTRLAIPDGVQSVGINAFHSTNAQLCCSMGSRAAEALSRVGYDFYTETWKLRYTFDSDKQVNGLCAERYLGSDAAVTLPEGTTLIGGSAFKDCAFITSVTLPEKLLSIGNYAFSGCTGLTEIVIPDSVTTIGSYAFSGCTGLTEIVIPDSVTTIGSYAFSGCTGLTEIVIPDSVTAIGNYAFSGCTGLTRVVLPAGLTAIPDCCFNNCEKLPGIAIPETVTSIGSCAFRYCSALTAITLPQGLQTLGANAFLYCENLPYVDVPDTLESAGSYIASDTTQLRCSIGSSAAYTLSKNGTSFYDDGYKLRYTYADRDGSVTGLVLLKYAGTEAEVRVPDGVTELGSLCFWKNSVVTSIVLPETVIKIGWEAFSECKNLTSVTVPQGVVEIQSAAFSMCPKLKVIDIPDGLQKAAWLAEDDVRLRCSFGSSAAFALSKGGNSFCTGDFQMRYLFDEDGNRNGLRLNKYLGTDAEVTVPEEVTETGSAFKDCKTVTKVVLPAGLTKLESDIFSGCTALKEIAIPEGVTSIGNGAFRDCEALTELALPQGLKKIESYAFIGCTGLSYIDIPDGVETIDGYIVNEPTQLRCTLGSSAAIALSKSDNGFCVDGLRLCYGFDDDGNTNGLTAKRYLGSETEVTVPDGVDSIGDSAFYGCKGLTKLALPQGLKEIGVNAFLGCEGLSYIDIPDGVETVGDWIASESTQLRCSIGSSAAIALSKAEQNFCVDDFAVRHSFTDGGAVNGLIAERYVGGKVGAVLTLPQGVTETSQYLLNEEPLENVMCLKLPEGFKKLSIDNLLWRSAVVFPESIQSIAIEEEWEGAPPVIFYCYRDTVAESFAQKRGITIVYLDGFKPAQTTVAMRSDYTLPIGSELRLSEIAAAVPSMPENCALNAVSSNPEVLQVESDGTIRVVGKGDATLRVSLSRYPDIYAEACVWGYVQPTSATLAEEIWIPAKATRDLLKKDLIILPADNRAPIGYGMDNWELFEQLEGEFTLMAVNRGDTALYVEVPGFDTLTAQIHVTARFSELAFEQTAITIPADTRATLCAQAVTTTHTYVNEYMTFESSAPDVATVDEDGVVYGVSEGSATITATSYNGLTAACTVNVQGGNGSRLKLPAFLKEIGEEAFAGCSEESVIVPDGCETIGVRAFADSANLRTITIPASVTSIAADAFDGCTDLTIRTPKGSYASRYAAAHGLGCVAE